MKLTFGQKVAQALVRGIRTGLQVFAGVAGAVPTVKAITDLPQHIAVQFDTLALALWAGLYAFLVAFAQNLSELLAADAGVPVPPRA